MAGDGRRGEVQDNEHTPRKWTPGSSIHSSVCSQEGIWQWQEDNYQVQSSNEAMEINTTLQVAELKPCNVHSQACTHTHTRLCI